MGSQKSNNKANALSFLNSSSIDDISESIYNILYNEKLNLNFSKSQKAKLKNIIKPNVKSFEDISKRNVPIKRRHTKIIQQGSGISTILLVSVNSCSYFIIDQKIKKWQSIHQKKIHTKKCI